MELQLTLPPEPASAAAARHLAADTLRAWRHDDLVEVTELLVSELVTNAVLHAGSEIDLRLLSSGAGVRVEVADASDVMPARRSFGRQASTGRGLGLVEMLASSWGAESRRHGKVVWFQVGAPELESLSEADLLAAFPDLDDPLPPDVTDHAPADSVEQDPQGVPKVELRLLELPIGLYRAMEQHNEALLRESMLRGFAGAQTLEDLSHRPVGGIGAAASRLPLRTPAVEAELQDALDAGATAVDLRLTVGPGSREVCGELLVALDEADELARAGRLLVPAALPEIRACRQWYLGEVIAQVDGAAPTPWSPPVEVGDADVPLLGRVEPGAVLDNLNDAVVVGDDGNRIRYLNPAAERLLGWSRTELEGRRITVIVPPHLREAHVVGYSRYLVTDKPRLIGQPVRVPARHRNGDELPVELLLSTFRAAGGQRVFVAVLRDLSERVQREHTVATRSALTATSDVAALFGPTGPGETLQALAPLVLQTLGRHLGCQVALLWRPDGSEEELTCTAAWDDGSEGGAGFAAATRHRQFGPGVGIPGRVWESGEPVWVPDVVADANFTRANLALENGLRSALAFPITTGGRVWGVMEMLSRDVFDPDADVLAIMAAMGRQLGAHADDVG